MFVNDGALPIDNNQVERLMKRIAVGRKDWLLIGSLRAGIRNASLMSLVASALRQDIDVAMYLESVITHMLRGMAKTEELLPDRWKAAHPQAVREYREQERRDKADMAVVQQHGVGYVQSSAKAIAHQKSHDRRAVPMGFRALRTEPTTWATCICGTSRLRPQCQPHRATNRSIHLEPLTDLGHISKPEHQ